MVGDPLSLNKHAHPEYAAQVFYCIFMNATTDNMQVKKRKTYIMFHLRAESKRAKGLGLGAHLEIGVDA